MMENRPGLGPRVCDSTCPLKARFHFQLLWLTTPRVIWGTGAQRQPRWVRAGWVCGGSPTDLLPVEPHPYPEARGAHLATTLMSKPGWHQESMRASSLCWRRGELST